MRQPAVDRQVTGRVVVADDERVVLETESGQVEHRYAALGPGRVQVEFHRLDEIDEADEVDDDDDEFDGDEHDAADEDDDDDVEDEER